MEKDLYLNSSFPKKSSINPYIEEEEGQPYSLIIENELRFISFHALLFCGYEHQIHLLSRKTNPFLKAQSDENDPMTECSLIRSQFNLILSFVILRIDFTFLILILSYLCGLRLR